MIKIVIPSNNIKEREYIIDVIFNQFFNLPYQVLLSNNIRDEYYIYIDKERKIVIKDAFFSLYPKNLEYLKISSIPKEISYMEHNLCAEKDIPVLFGKPIIQKEKNSTTSHIDIFATLFFMLTRWEEYVNTTRDNHNRFPHTESLAYQHDFLHRPIVNEYIELLWNILKELGYSSKRKEEAFSILLTHDVDEILRYPNIKRVLVAMAGDIILRKSLPLALKTLIHYPLILMGKKRDPYDSFDEIMDMSDSFNIQSHFFFMSGGTTPYDNRYNIREPRVKTIIEKIKARGHAIGIHPSYSAYNDPIQFKLEKEVLEEINQEAIVTGREHYLRFEVPHTWQLWEDNHFEWCSNLAYAQSAGFRTGCCSPYSPFNILSQKQLTVKERPLIMMEVTFVQEAPEIEDFDKMVDYYLNIVKKYNGEFVLLWHNASLHDHAIKPYTPSYRRTLQQYKSLV